MILPFSTQIEGKPNLFVEKILTGLKKNKLINNSVFKQRMYAFCLAKPIFGMGNECICDNKFNPKLHTFREDKTERWKTGNNIHFVINNRTPKYCQFAPVLPCISTQRVGMYFNSERVFVDIDGKRYCSVYYGKKGKKNIIQLALLSQLAINDGFESVTDFIQYFSKESSHWQGKIIHWTNLKY